MQESARKVEQLNKTEHVEFVSEISTVMRETVLGVLKSAYRFNLDCDDAMTYFDSLFSPMARNVSFKKWPTNW